MDGWDRSGLGAGWCGGTGPGRARPAHRAIRSGLRPAWRQGQGLALLEGSLDAAYAVVPELLGVHPELRHPVRGQLLEHEVVHLCSPPPRQHASAWAASDRQLGWDRGSGCLQGRPRERLNGTGRPSTKPPTPDAPGLTARLGALMAGTWSGAGRAGRASWPAPARGVTRRSRGRVPARARGREQLQGLHGCGRSLSSSLTGGGWWRTETIRKAVGFAHGLRGFGGTDEVCSRGGPVRLAPPVHAPREGLAAVLAAVEDGSADGPGPLVSVRSLVPIVAGSRRTSPLGPFRPAHGETSIRLVTMGHLLGPAQSLGTRPALDRRSAGRSPPCGSGEGRS